MKTEKRIDRYLNEGPQDSRIRWLKASVKKIEKELNLFIDVVKKSGYEYDIIRVSDFTSHLKEVIDDIVKAGK